MDVSTREVDGVLVADLSGRLDTRTSGAASDELSRVAQGDHRKVLLNLEGLEFLSSAGLRVFLRTAKALRKVDGILKVSGARGVVKEVMEISGFHDLLDLHDTETEALASF